MTGDEVERERGRVEGAELDKQAVRRQESAPLWQNRTRDASPQIINGREASTSRTALHLLALFLLAHTDQNNRIQLYIDLHGIAPDLLHFQFDQSLAKATATALHCADH